MSVVRAVKKNDPAARNIFEILLLYSGVHAIFYYRIAHFFYKIKLKFLARCVSQLARFLTGIEIHPGAKIGKELFIDHGMGVVIGETAEIGDHCVLYQGVTLGGTGKDKGKRHPNLGDNVMIGAGAKVLGPITIGSGSKVGAGAVVLREVPENSIAVGVPARIIKSGARIDSDPDLNQTDLPDPVFQQFEALSVRVELLEKRLNQREQVL